MENFNLLEKKENPLFKRKEIIFTIGNEITPTYAEVMKFVSEEFSVPKENIRIKNIIGRFGKRVFTIIVNIYDSEKDKLDTEGKSKKDVLETQSEKIEVEIPKQEEEAEAKPEAKKEEKIEESIEKKIEENKEDKE